MLKERLKALFKSYDRPIQQIIFEVGELEQQYISMKNPRGIRDEIDEVVTKVAKQELENMNRSADED